MSDTTGYGVFRDSDGNLSSKRIIGTVLLGSGGLFLLAVGVLAVWKTVADPQTSLDVGRTLIYSGAALLGVGVVEKLGPKGAAK